MNQGTIQNVAEAYQKSLDTTYHFIAENKKGEKLDIYFEFQKEEFTHVIGLDHLPIVKMIGEGKAKKKHFLFEQILEGKFTENNFNLEDNNALTNEVSKNTNPTTEKKYTIEDRINLAIDISNLILVKDKTQIYKNWYSKKSHMKADYVLAVPSPNNSHEKIYFFAYEPSDVSKNNRNKNASIRVNVFSFYADSFSLTNGQSKPYLVKQEDIISRKDIDKTPMTVFKSAECNLQPLNKPQPIKFEIPQIPQTVANYDGTVAVVSQPKEIAISSPPPLNDLFNKLKQSLSRFTEDIKSAVKSLFKGSPKKTVTKEKPVPAQKKETTPAKSQQKALLKLQQPQQIKTVEKDQHEAVAASTEPKQQGICRFPNARRENVQKEVKERDKNQNRDVNKNKNKNDIEL